MKNFTRNIVVPYLSWAGVGFTFLMFLLLTFSPLEASPRIISDPAPIGSIIPDTFEWVGVPAPMPTSNPAEPDGSANYDLAASPVGTFPITVRVCKSDPLWGKLCSAYVPFSWTRPGGPPDPVGLRAAP